jgi:hypothetical protein
MDSRNRKKFYRASYILGGYGAGVLAMCHPEGLLFSIMIFILPSIIFLVNDD